MALFALGDFTSSSGKVLPFKIECDALTDADWHCLAVIGHGIMARKFGTDAIWYVGIPRGGLRFADYLNKCAVSENNNYRLLCIADDVFTTGATIEKFKKSYNTTYSLVAFDRSVQVHSYNHTSIMKFHSVL